MALGLAVIAGWHTHVPVLMQTRTHLVPMQYNTALAFLFAGGGLLAASLYRHLLSVVCGGAALAFGALTLIEYAFGVDLHIDQLFFKHYITIHTISPGRMAPNTAVCFILSGAGLILTGIRPESQLCRHAAGLIAALMSGLGAAAFAGYAIELPTASRWGNFATTMAVNTSLGFFALGTGLGILALIHSYRHSALSIAVGIVPAIVASVLWQAMYFSEAKEHPHIEHLNRMSYVSLFFGLGMSAALSFAIHTVIRVRYLADKAQAAVLQLGEEISARKKRETSLRLALDEARRFADALDNVSAYVYIKDRQFNYLYANRLTLELFQRTPHTLPGCSDSDFFPPEAVARLQEVDARVLKGDRTEEEIRVSTDDGNTRVYWEVKSPMRDGDGTISGICGISTDITDYKHIEAELRDAKQFSDDVISSLPGVFYVVNEEGRMARWNRKLKELTGYTDEELMGKNALDMIAENDRQMVADRIRLVFQQGEASVEAALLTKSGKQITHYLTGRRTVLGDRHYLVGLGEDVSLRKRAEQEWRESEKRFRAYFERSMVGMATTSPEKGWLDVNDALCESLGYTREELAGMTWAELTHPEDLPPDAALFNRVLKGEIDGYAMDKRFIHKDGHIVFTRLAVRCVRKEDGNVDYFVALVENITERKRAEISLAESEQNFRIVFENAVVGIARVSTEGRFLQINQEFCRIIGYSQEEVLSKRMGFQQITYPEDIESDMASVKRLLDGEDSHYTMEKRYIRKDGLVVWVLLSVYLLRDASGAPLYFISAVQDISRQKADESALKKARHLAEAANTAKSMFLATMSHEIRTPMNGILGLVQLALEQPLSSRVRDYLKKINDSSGSLLNILNDILDYSKIEAGILSIEARPFNLDALLEDARNLFSLRAEEKGLEFSITVADNVPRRLVSDELRLRQVLMNLLSNAIKFTERGKVSLEVTFRGMERSKARLLFRVSDTGIGMSEDAIAKLFHPFTQADSSITRRFGGTGLGLAISGRILRLLGTECRVESSPGDGSVFSFELDADRATAETQPGLNRLPSEQQDTHYPEDSVPVSGALVLVAEDNQINQQIVEEILVSRGVRTRKAANGKEALELIERERFDAVFMDIQMPVMDGLEAARRLRRDPRFVSLPVIALTAGVTEDERKKAMESGMNYFLSKPINRKALFDTLARCIASGHAGLKTVDVRQNAGESRLPALAGIDLSHLHKFVRGDEGIAKLLLHFYRDARKTMGLIEDKLLSGDYEEARRLLHGLKGMSGNIAAKDLHEAAVSVEKEWKSGLYNGAALLALRSAYSVVMNSLEKLRGEGEVADKPSGAAAAADFLPLANRLETLLSGKYFVPDDLLTQLEFVMPLEGLDAFRQIKRHIENIQYGKALDLLKRLAGDVKNGTV